MSSPYLKELLVKNKGHTGDFFDAGFFLRIVIDEVGRDGDRQFTPGGSKVKTMKNAWFAILFLKTKPVQLKKANS